MMIELASIASVPKTCSKIIRQALAQGVSDHEQCALDIDFFIEHLLEHLSRGGVQLGRVAWDVKRLFLTLQAMCFFVRTQTG